MRPAYGKTEKCKEHTKYHQNKTLTHLYKSPKTMIAKAPKKLNSTYYVTQQFK